MNQYLLKTEIRIETDIVWIRKKTLDFAQYFKLDKQDQTRLATAVSEITRNTFQYAKRGFVEFSFHKIIDNYFLVIIVKDNGPGIKNLKEILNGTYVSPEGMGVGLAGSRKLVDDLRIDTGPEGTTVTLYKSVSNRIGLLTPSELKILMDQFVGQNTYDPSEVIHKQNQEILLTLNLLNEKKEELERLNKELQDTNRGVLALYAELDEKAESLRIANEKKTSFLSNMTHEFRSPLNSILSISDILIEEAKEENKPEKVKQVNFIIKAAQGLSDLVNDLLDIAKIEAGKISLRIGEFQVEEVFSTMRGLMRPLGNINPDVQLTFNDVDESLVFRSDEGKVTQILRNLVSNAIKYTLKGDIIVSAWKADDEHICLSVQDTGIGIADEHIDDIFQEFIQIDNPEQKKHKGTGLGLPLTKKLVTLLGGEISVQSELNKGTTFLVKLPMNYEEASSTDVQYKEVTGEVNRILVIDDEEIHRKSLKEVITKLKFDIREAKDGKEGLDVAAVWKPDLIILDLVMPVMDGYEFLRKIMTIDNLKDIPIILYTSKDLEVEEREYLEQVTNMVLNKQTNKLEEISKVLRELRDQRSDV